MQTLLRLAVIAAISFALPGGALAADEVVATAADSGKTISVHMGQILTVNLMGSHGSDKHWRLNSDMTPELILTGRTTDSVAVSGAPETTSYAFTTNAPGKLEFKASYLPDGAAIPQTSDVEFTVDVLP